jgi:ribosomal protein S18 acetylase RimI-like enzyme
MSNLTSRWYRDEERMLRLVTACALRDGVAYGHLHAGDVVWGLCQNPTIVPAERVRLFEDGHGELCGFTWIHPPHHIMLQLDSAMPGYAGLVAAMLRWAEGHLGEGDPITTEVSSLDTRLQEALRGAGYRPTGAGDYRLNVHKVTGAIPALSLPEGATVRPVRLDDPDEVSARVELHREVWEPSKFTHEGYERLRTKPVYRPDLDLVAVTPAGELAAYGIVWWDPETRTAEFEPVGTSPRFRRQGYGRALLLGALGRLRALGAEWAIVVSETGDDSKPARGLYEAVGFAPVLTFDTWERDPAAH